MSYARTHARTHTHTHSQCNDIMELDSNITTPLVDSGAEPGGSDVLIDAPLGTSCAGVQLSIRHPGLEGSKETELRPLLGAPAHAFVARRSNDTAIDGPDLDRIWHLHLGTPVSFAASLNTNGVTLLFASLDPTP